MPGRVRGISGHRAEPFAGGWEIAASEPGRINGPADPDLARLGWNPATVPSTVASILRGAGLWSLDGAPRRFDADEWWYRLQFEVSPAETAVQRWLCFDGLATVADVWLNATLLIESQDMFTEYERRVDALLRPENTLLIRFRSLDALLAVKRPRPRWRAPMVEHQQLRWFRTTLLGRTPGWSPPAAAVGPWRAIRMEHRRGASIRDVQLSAGADGAVMFSCAATTLEGGAVRSGDLLLSHGGRSRRIALGVTDATGRLAGRAVFSDAARWWPHTHGEPALHEAQLVVRHGGGEQVAELGRVGFRDVALETAAGDFSLSVNGVSVFCRGACWTPLDPVALDASDAALDGAFAQVVEAGMNMLRVGGTMVYESDAFLDRADSHGVMLWQDLMFANMDYPAEDAGFVARVCEEARQQLARFAGRPSLAVICGNSEGEQQAAMFGAPRDRWAPTLFHETLAEVARTLCPSVPFWPSSAHGGAFPHQGNSGSTSYYGVGAYLRPLDDARRAEVRFASECLAFANVPEDASLARLPGGLGVRVHHAAWKARSPRDLGAGWDFDDVRDHYLGLCFGVDPLALRYGDHDRYLALSRVASGEVMSAVFAEWRRRRSTTRGGLIWFLRDLWHGAGWGVVDAEGTPKAAWYYLRRALAPVAISISDEGGNGLGLHLVNDGAVAVRGDVELALFRAGEVSVGRATRPVEVPPHEALEFAADELFDGFRDLGYAYRFGPRSHNLVTAVLRDSTGSVRSRAFHFIGDMPNEREHDVGLVAEASCGAEGDWTLEVRTRRFAQSVRLEIAGFRGEDDYFHLAPGEQRTLRLVGTGTGTSRTPQGKLIALNAETPAKVSVR